MCEGMRKKWDNGSLATDLGGVPHGRYQGSHGCVSQQQSVWMRRSSLVHLTHSAFY